MEAEFLWAHRPHAPRTGHWSLRMPRGLGAELRPPPPHPRSLQHTVLNEWWRRGGGEAGIFTTENWSALLQSLWEVSLDKKGKRKRRPESTPLRSAKEPQEDSEQVSVPRAAVPCPGTLTKRPHLSGPQSPPLGGKGL